MKAFIQYCKDWCRYKRLLLSQRLSFHEKAYHDYMEFQLLREQFKALNDSQPESRPKRTRKTKTDTLPSEVE